MYIMFSRFRTNKLLIACVYFRYLSSNVDALRGSFAPMIDFMVS